jgi:hypothetical protein
MTCGDEGGALVLVLVYLEERYRVARGVLGSCQVKVKSSLYVFKCQAHCVARGVLLGEVDVRALPRGPRTRVGVAHELLRQEKREDGMG